MRTRRVLCISTMFHWEPEGSYRQSLYSYSALLVLNGTSLNSVNAPLAVNWWYDKCDPSVEVNTYCQATFCFLNHISAVNKVNMNTGPVHICSRYTTPANCSRNKFSVHERSDCEHCEMFLVPLRSDLKSAHISVCAVWLIVYTLRNVWGHFNVHSPRW